MAQQHNASLLPKKQAKLEVGVRPTPTPQGTQALVKVTAAAVNPADWKIIDSGLFIEKFPAVLGFDGTGVVHAVGQEVTNFKIGDRVLFQGTLDPDRTSFQEYALVETHLITKAPDNINDDQGSTIPSGAITAYAGLFLNTGIDPPLNGPTANGKPVLVLGGSSSVGQFVIQFARIAGFSPIVTTASPQHADFLKSLGATHVFDRDADVQTIQSAFPVPVALAYDAISADSTQLLAFDVLTTPASKSDARIILVNPPTDSLGEKNKGDKIIVDNVRVFGLSDTFSTPFWQKIGQWVEGEEIVPNRVQLVGGGLAGVPEALDLSRKGVSGVKLVVRPQE
ncbi:Zinc-type alcohol dehydrogenase-like protein C2E1P3,01 OS=Schizosaccharomyces pombe (strain 972 / ATCC 24843) GN=SPAC2E1P3.01 PE=3 SV=1 [Rhizoctonia solani AG-1 IB]|uniref:Zinc-type alcohol dehydrogenase-like protein C2E1P3,01 n=1 Tax=Thanatephorus cucumeris (strain AG1-IB / isolate 7/3/14) TaxID=1108050 RepID=A0A0B7FK56_THACB|nr:Zinc-type alcohol dehydrogenase-like protein C2E1P3,01 OS=Schizosaccharomyces pombe (strain 972 / ATCC 24843) GN=SPAC2E1P3.01 PE=3 SV=1 [Rhizoctonia solani AG-1 IB]